MRTRVLLSVLAVLALLAGACAAENPEEAALTASEGEEATTDDAAAGATASEGADAVGAEDVATEDAPAGDMATEGVAEEGLAEEGMATEGTADEGMAGMDDESTEGEMDMEGMDMGDADAIPADQVEGADLQSGEFVLLNTAPDGYEQATGEAFIARTDDGVTVTLYVEGLPADTEYVSHVHALSCDEDNGGPHFKYDPDGGDTPPNEIHLNFTTDAEGSGMMTATNDMVPGPEAMSVAIHPADEPDSRALCATFA